MSPLRGDGGMHPPFFFVLPKKNAPCTVEEKGAFGLCTQRRREIPQTLPTRPRSLLPAALSILRKPILLRRKLRKCGGSRGGKPKGLPFSARAFRFATRIPGQ